MMEIKNQKSKFKTKL